MPQQPRGRHGHLTGGARPPEYSIWLMANQRCHNQRCPDYPTYGGRGIRVCGRWRGEDGYANFLADLGPQPRPGYGLVRTDPDGDFGPDNVRWGPTRSGRPLSWQGKTKSIPAWARELGLRPGTIRARLAAGWGVAAALTPRIRPRWLVRPA
jgi:hypothetical protein